MNATAAEKCLRLPLTTQGGLHTMRKYPTKAPHVAAGGPSRGSTSNPLPSKWPTANNWNSSHPPMG